jgi:hypothetical protein
VPVYETVRSRAYTGRHAQLQTSAYELLCYYALRKEATKPPPQPDGGTYGCFGPDGKIVVALEGGETKLLEYDSELYIRVSNAWGHMASAIAWAECAPPSR